MNTHFNPQFEFAKIDGPSVRAHRMELVAHQLKTVWRNRMLIVLSGGLFAILAAVAALILPKQYTAEALIQQEFAVTQSPTSSGGITVDAGSVIDGRARVLRSHAIARQVVTRLNLLDRYAPRSTTEKLFGGLPFIGPVFQRSEASRADIAAMRMSKDLKIKNDFRSYVISVTFTAESPESAARIANAFVVQYQRSRAIQALSEQVGRANGNLVELIANYGELHPSVTRARSMLAQARANLKAEEDAGDEEAQTENTPGGGFVMAEAVEIPSNSPGILMVIGGLLTGLVIGLGFVLGREKLAPGFRTAGEAAEQTGLPVLGSVPVMDGRDLANAPATQRDALRLLSLNASLAPDDQPRIVLVTSPLPTQATSHLAAGLSHVLAGRNARVLTIYSSPMPAASVAWRLTDVLANPATSQAVLEPHSIEPVTIIHDYEPGSGAQLFDTPEFDRFLEEARTRFTTIVIEAPAVLGHPDAVILGKQSDIVMLNVAANATPRGAAIAAVDILRNAKVRISGLIITDAPSTVRETFAVKDLEASSRKLLMQVKGLSERFGRRG